MHRVTLSAAELSLLAAHAGVALPAGLPSPQSPVPAGPDDWPGGTAAVLRRRGLVDGDDTPVPAVATTLTVLAAPTVTVRVEVTLPGRARTSLYAVSGGLGAALRHLDDDEFELALFPAWELTTELHSAVPALHPASRPRDGVHAYAARGDVRPVVTHRDRPPTFPAGAHGALLATVTGADGTTFGVVEWLATDTGWLGHQPVARHGGVPAPQVRPGEFGTWLAPAVDSALAAAS